jgi:phosphopantetheinyl transferase (holo-ACP synthase)
LTNGSPCVRQSHPLSFASWQFGIVVQSTQQIRSFVNVSINRWSVKEAVYKAMYPTLRPTWKEITYQGLTASGQKPSIIYHPIVQGNLRKVGRMHVSVSHDGEYSYASVIVEGMETH